MTYKILLRFYGINSTHTYCIRIYTLKILIPATSERAVTFRIEFSTLESNIMVYHVHGAQY